MLHQHNMQIFSSHWWSSCEWSSSVDINIPSSFLTVSPHATSTYLVKGHFLNLERFRENRTMTFSHADTAHGNRHVMWPIDQCNNSSDKHHYCIEVRWNMPHTHIKKKEWRCHKSMNVDSMWWVSKYKWLLIILKWK